MDPGHEPWIPHGYQERASDWLIDRPVSMLWLDPGLGKTSIVLDAFTRLLAAGEAKRMLVVAPLRVCQLVWRQEAARWSQFRHLRFASVTGSAKKRKEALAADADVWLINPENVPWLAEQLRGRGWPWDVLTIDELTKFKNNRSKRNKALQPLAKRSNFRWGLTGTPIPNGYMDLFGQTLVLDDGRAFGQYITHFRDRYFSVGFTGFDYTLKHGAAAQIEERLKDYVLRMSAEDYLDMPQLVQDVRKIEIGKKALQQYRDLKREAVLSLGEDGTVVAANAGAVYSKLKQLSNGAVYIETPEGKRYAHIHDAKVDALEELIEEMAGAQLLVAYEFRHDLERLRGRFGEDIPYLGSGVSAARAEELEAAWNAGEIPVLFAHPASVGHGLNLQRGGAHHLCWFSVTIDYELYDQFLRRLLRQGNKSARIINHALVVPGTVDEMSLDIIAGKKVTQDNLLQALNAEVVGGASNKGDDDMVRKVRRKSEVEATEETAAPKGKGWGGSAEEDDEEDEDEEVEEAPRRRTRKASASKVRSRVAGEEEEDDAEDDAGEEEEHTKPGFSRKVREKVRRGRVEEEDDGEEEADDEEEEEAPAPRKRTTRKTKRAPEPADDAESDEDDQDGAPFDGGSQKGGGPIMQSAEEVVSWRRDRALQLAAQFAERLSLKTPAEAVKAAEVFEKFLSGE